MALIKIPEEIKTLREGGQILARILSMVASTVKPGVSTFELDDLARQEIIKAGAQAAFLGYQIASDQPPYPAALCTSINDEVVHGVPKPTRFLKAGDIVGLDLGIKYRGLYTDAAVTVPVGRVSNEAKRLIDVTKAALEAGLNQIKEGNTLGDVASAIEAVAKTHSLGVIRDLGGHGVGHVIHENPFVPNFGRPGTLQKLRAGMVLALEPMFTLGDWRIRLLDDGWTVVTADGSLAAHFEHTVAVTQGGCEILTKIHS